MMRYNQALKDLMSLTDFGIITNTNNSKKRRYDLSRVINLSTLLGNPEDSSPNIHIAGTKGKGSTSVFIASILKTAGYNTGLFTSPHIHRLTERIQINNNEISKNKFTNSFYEMWPLVQRYNQQYPNDQITLFEFLTVLAFYIFQKENTDINVIEVGLGGKLDSTNILNPHISIITSISLDHTGILGNTLEEVALQKAGIIKQDKITVIAPQKPEVLKIIKAVCEEKNNQYIAIQDSCEIIPQKRSKKFQTYLINSEFGNESLAIPLFGDYQIENSATAFITAKLLQNTNFSISKSSIKAGLKHTSWPCRLEKVSSKPLIILDGAHNPYSIEKMIHAIFEYYTFNNITIIFGASRDKDITDMVKILLENDHGKAHYIATHSRHPKNAPVNIIQNTFKHFGIDILTVDSISKSIKIAKRNSAPDDLILVTGSLFIAAEAREKILGISKENYIFNS
jgi:dihydrofolate synthase/folylpolyglutamate synthase